MIIDRERERERIYYRRRRDIEVFARGLYINKERVTTNVRKRDVRIKDSCAIISWLFRGDDTKRLYIYVVVILYYNNVEISWDEKLKDLDLL